MVKNNCDYFLNDEKLWPQFSKWWKTITIFQNYQIGPNFPKIAKLGQFYHNQKAVKGIKHSIKQALRAVGGSQTEWRKGGEGYSHFLTEVRTLPHFRGIWSQLV